VNFWRFTSYKNTTNQVDKKNKSDAERPKAEKEKFTEGRDYYFEDGLMVLTAHFLRKRGYCCGSGCRHCPYRLPGRTGS
jgi:hypothetical protein